MAQQLRDELVSLIVRNHAVSSVELITHEELAPIENADVEKVVDDADMNVLSLDRISTCGRLSGRAIVRKVLERRVRRNEGAVETVERGQRFFFGPSCCDYLAQVTVDYNPITQERSSAMARGDGR